MSLKKQQCVDYRQGGRPANSQVIFFASKYDATWFHFTVFYGCLKKTASRQRSLGRKWQPPGCPLTLAAGRSPSDCQTFLCVKVWRDSAYMQRRLLLQYTLLHSSCTMSVLGNSFPEFGVDLPINFLISILYGLLIRLNTHFTKSGNEFGNQNGQKMLICIQIRNSTKPISKRLKINKFRSISIHSFRISV